MYIDPLPITEYTSFSMYVDPLPITEICAFFYVHGSPSDLRKPRTFDVRISPSDHRNMRIFYVHGSASDLRKPRTLDVRISPSDEDHLPSTEYCAFLCTWIPYRPQKTAHFLFSMIPFRQPKRALTYIDGSPSDHRKPHIFDVIVSP